jgi:hypothetical protein
VGAKQARATTADDLGIAEVLQPGLTLGLAESQAGGAAMTAGLLAFGSLGS